MAALICLEAEYMCFINGIRFINHSPSQKTEDPNHDEANMPTKNMKSIDVTNPRPVVDNILNTFSNHQFSNHPCFLK